MKVRRTEFLLLVALASSALAMQIREDTLSASNTGQQPTIACNEPASTSATANPVIDAACRSGQDPREVRGTLHHTGAARHRVQIQV